MKMPTFGRANSTQQPANDPANDNLLKKSNLPVSLSPQRGKPSLNTNTIPAEFVSQLIAERSRMASQRPKRRAPVSLATRAYNMARIVAIKRMPAGFTHETNV
ncbi:MAG: hypothetical protein L3J13_02765 [Devosiaceae bacterium]|nr:hypothetical protein [Devosiaceae bacterium]